MNILGVQLILIAFAVFMMYVLFLHWKKRNISNKMFGWWLFVWLVYLFFAFFPTLLSPLLSKLFIVRVMDLGMIVAFMVITYVTLENNVRIKKLQDDLEKLVRELAINKTNKKNE